MSTEEEQIQEYEASVFAAIRQETHEAFAVYDRWFLSGATLGLNEFARLEKLASIEGAD